MRNFEKFTPATLLCAYCTDTTTLSHTSIGGIEVTSSMLVPSQVSPVTVGVCLGVAVVALVVVHLVKSKR